MKRTDKVGIIYYRLNVRGRFYPNDIMNEFEICRRTLSYCIADLNYYFIFESDAPRIIIYMRDDDLTSDYAYRLCDAKEIQMMMESHFNQLGKLPKENEVIEYYKKLLRGKTYWQDFLRKVNLINENDYLKLSDGYKVKKINIKQIRILKLIDYLETLPYLCMKKFLVKEKLKSEQTIYKYLSTVDLYLFETGQNDKEVRWHYATKRAKIIDKNSLDEDKGWKHIR